ncbi:MAG TPA: peptidoglycan DD-metalloendopeptidase family protein [Trichocoleus sp.]
MVRLIAPYTRVKIADKLFQRGDGLLRFVSVSLGEDKRASSCRFEVFDPGLKIGAEFFQISFDQGGIVVPSELLQDPQPPQGTVSSVPGATAGTGAVNRSLTAEERAFLDVLAFAEGTSGPNGYNTMFTGRTFSNGYADHPRQNICSGRLCSTAAGRYQFLSSTWDELKLPDFSPENQDKGGIMLVQRRGALADVNARNFASAIQKCNREWASLPGSPYGQPTKSLAELTQVWEAALAKYSTDTPETQQANTPPAIADTAPAAPVEVSKKGTEIIVSLGFSPQQLTNYHFIHTGTHTRGRALDSTVFEGQSVRWLMTRRTQNTTYQGITLRQLAQKVCDRYGLTLQMEGDGPTYQHLDQSGISDYQLLLREAQAIGYRITESAATLKLEPYRPNFTGFVITRAILMPGSLQFTDRASQDMPAMSGGSAPTTATRTTTAAAEQKTEIDRQTGQLTQAVAEDSMGTSTAATAPPTATITGADRPPLQGNPAPESRPGGIAASSDPITGLPTQQIGAIDLADGRAEAELIQDESRRVKGYESSAQILTTPEALTLAPGSILGLAADMVPEVFAREWRVGAVSHNWQLGSTLLTDLEFYTPQRQKPAEAATAIAAPGAAASTTLNPSGFILPIGSGRIGDGVGRRSSGRNHNGIDVAAPTGTPIIAAADGRVVRTVTGYGGGWGWHVVLQHANNIYSLYGHLSAISVANGQEVKQGQEVGKCGSTGRSSGPHLHFEFRDGGAPPAGRVLIPSELGVSYASLSGSQRSGFKY